MSTHLEQLERDGYTIIPNFLDRETTARVRAHMDDLIGPIDSPEGELNRTHELRHPIPGAIMAEILNRPHLLELAQEILYTEVEDLRMLEQVLIRTDARTPSPEDLEQSRATGWHLDMTFLPEHYDARPRQTYFHMVHALSEVPEGGGGTAIVPGSHHKTYEAARKIGSTDGLQALKDDPIAVAGIDLSEAVELHPHEGDLLIFNPMCLHSASTNISTSPRYVYFVSFRDDSAQYLKEFLRSTNYNKSIPDSLRDNLPAELQSLLT